MDCSNECTWPEIKQRAHYVGWLACAIAATALLGLTFDLLVVKLTGGEVGALLSPLLGGSAVVPPCVYIWRRYGETHAGFLELEHALSAAFAGTATRGFEFAEIDELIARIEAARGMDRQVIRNEAKAWLLAHADELSLEERDYVDEHLGYLSRR